MTNSTTVVPSNPVTHNNSASQLDKPYVVGIGASAGGLEALERFFGAMPADSGMAFVVIQHLSPDFKSMMDELLGRVTPMSIRQVVELIDIHPDTVYILPPRKEMVIRSGKLLTQDKPTDQQLNMPINTFFRSLAREQGDRSIAIVLSGTGSDGSMGIQDVHEVGGLVFAQDEESAKFDGMPKSAMNTGCVDVCLAPENMPAILLEYLRNPSRILLNLRSERHPGEPLTGIAAVLEKLKEIYDLDFSFYKSATITRRIDRRVMLGGSGIFQDYIDLVLRDLGELDRLYKDLLIGVTRFFRDEEAFISIAKTVIPLILDSTPAESEIRVWIPACATGEEAYSLGMLFLEAFEQRKREPNLKIFATDMHRDSLQRASEGLYNAEDLKAIMSTQRREYFFIHESNDIYRVIPSLRKLLIFSQHNLIKDPPFTRVDLVSCRNLLIYFEQPAQNKVLASFHFSLKPHGFLLLGPSEGTGDLASEFDTIDRQWRIFRKTRDVRLPFDMRGGLKLLSGKSPIHPFAAQGTRLPYVYDELLNRYMPTGALVNERREVLHIFGNAARFLKHSTGQISNDIMDLTHGDLRIALASALQNVGKKNERVELKGVRHVDAEGEIIFNIIAEPVDDKYRGGKFTMMLFQERVPLVPREPQAVPNFDVSEEARQRILGLEQELLHTREALQSTIEELETSGEELQASNEELLASNEEMQSTNEELHSVNEELYSVNSEHEQKINELNELTADWRNLIRSIDIGIVFLREDYSIRLFSPKATEIFNLLPQDAGRDMRHITSRIANDDIFMVLPRVFKSRRSEESKLTCADGRTFLRRVLPYEGPDKSGSGIVITLVDVSESARAEISLRESEARFRGIIHAFCEGVLLINRDGLVLSCNEEAMRLLATPANEMIGNKFFDIQGLQVLREDGIPFPEGESPIARALSSGASSRGTLIGLRHQYVSDLWVIVNAEPIIVPDEQQVSVMLFTLTDITERKLVEEQLRIAAVALEAWEGMMVTDTEGTILRVNHAFTKITGYSMDEIIGRKPSLLKSGKHDADFYRQMWRKLNQEGCWQGEIWNRKKNGKNYPQWLTISAVRNTNGLHTHYVATFFDISDRKQAEEKIREMAFYDSLTNLPNRRLLMDRLEQALATSVRSGQFGALVMLDLDNFKTINDVYGHATGDKFLIDVSERIRRTVRDSDTVSRLGGDEFVLILENFGIDEFTAGAHAQKMVNKILTVLNEPYYFPVDQKIERYDTSASCGICLFQGQKNSAEDVLKHADVALYQAKDADGNTSRFFSEITQIEVNHAAQMDANLRLALREEHFQLYFQPQFDRDNRIIAAEALIRWLPPNGTMINPVEFIPFAEKNGLILPIGNWVLESACKTLKEWSKNPYTRSLRLAVNISARQFHEPLFCESVSSVLQRHEIDPTKLELELTESVVINDIGQAIAKMNAIKKLGIALSLDDFGSGYSSLTYLKRLPFEKLKIDREFIRDIMSDSDDAVIVRTIIAMGKALRLEVTAEGVETEEQFQYLGQQGCRLFQGYLFSPPVPLAAFNLIMENNLTPQLRKKISASQKK
ncbi:two-component system, chemotaxis family, CheB/CheR fusion protein [Gammaproteobacteria bacterium]